MAFFVRFCSRVAILFCWVALLQSCGSPKNPEASDPLAGIEEPLRSNLQTLTNSENFLLWVGNFSATETDSTGPIYAYNYLRDHVDEAQLYKLLNNSEPLVRLYAFRALKSGRDTDLFQLLKKNLDDSTSVMVREHEMVIHSTVADVLIKLSWEDLSATEQTELQELIFNNYRHLAAFERMLATLDAIPAYYEDIRSLAASGTNPAALVALAHYQKSADLPMIQQAIQAADCPAPELLWEAVAAYPDSSLSTPTLNYFESCLASSEDLRPENLRTYYQAVTALNTAGSLTVLQAANATLFEDDTDFNHSNKALLLHAMESRFDDQYAELFLELQQEIPDYKESIWSQVDRPADPWN